MGLKPPLAPHSPKMWDNVHVDEVQPVRKQPSAVEPSVELYCDRVAWPDWSAEAWYAIGCFAMASVGVVVWLAWSMH